MGWQISAIIIKNGGAFTPEQVANEFGYKKFIADTILSHALYPTELNVGKIGETLIITHGYILGQFFNEEPSPYEKKYYSRFPNAEMIVAALIENAGISGYSYIKNGERIRTFLFGEEEGEIINFGEPLPEENEVSPFDLPWNMPAKLLGDNLDQFLETPLREFSR